MADKNGIFIVSRAFECSKMKLIGMISGIK